MLAVTETNSLEGLKADGILGLSPGTKTNFSSTTNSFVQTLYENGVINERVFSFYMVSNQDYGKVSMFTLGGYDV